MCAIPMIFCDFEKTLITICLVFLFLIRTIQNSALSLCIYDEEKSCIDCFLHQEYTFCGRDWTTGETWHVPLSESV